MFNGKSTVAVAGLSKGIYILKMYVNGKIESHRIAVE